MHEKIIALLAIESCAEYFNTTPEHVTCQHRSKRKPTGGEAAQKARGHTVRLLRDFTDQSHREIAEHLGITQQSASYYESAYRNNVDERYDKEHEEILSIYLEKLHSCILMLSGTQEKHLVSTK